MGYLQYSRLQKFEFHFNAFLKSSRGCYSSQSQRDEHSQCARWETLISSRKARNISGRCVGKRYYIEALLHVQSETQKCSILHNSNLPKGNCPSKIFDFFTSQRNLILQDKKIFTKNAILSLKIIFLEANIMYFQILFTKIIMF